MSRRILMVACALLASSSCANILDIPESPTLVASDELQQCAAAQVKPPTAASARVTVHVCNFISSNCGMPVTGITADLCDKKDFQCANPIATDIHDVAGNLTFDVKTVGSLGNGFDGYLLIKPPQAVCTDEAAFGGPGACALPITAGCDPAAPDEKCQLPTYIPGLLFFNPPITEDVPAPMVVPLMPYLTSISLVKGAGSTQVDATLGNIVVTALDCAGRPAPGMTFGVSPNPPQFGYLYQVDGVISSAAVSTDESGLGGLLGVPAGFVKVSAYASGGLSAVGGEVASAGVQVNPTAVTYVTLLPSARH